MTSNRAQHEHNYQTEHCELCIIGAGIAGLNALSVASQYLSKNDKVILIDKNPTLGGMWNETYDYVRLHQPYQMFTAGNIEWTIKREPSYLASKNEVLAHFKHCVEVLRTKVTLVERYGYAYAKHSEVENGGSYEAHVICKAELANEKPLLIKAKKCVKALGFNIPINLPISLSSTNVRSVSPQSCDLFSEEMKASDKPVYIIGGGKTGMDTAHALITQYPKREINLIVGKGTVFFNRDVSFPKGLKRWWGGTTSLAAFLELALMFDGDNEAEVLNYFKKKYAVYLDQQFGYYLYGIMSEQENELISNGVNDVLIEYMTDIIDVKGQAKMLFRSGESRVIEPGSWIINCTGHIMRNELKYEPYLSKKGAVVSIQPTSGIHFLTTFSAYFLIHLLYLKKLDELPLYELNYNALLRKDKALAPFVSITQTLYNAIMIVDAVPFEVMKDCGLDFNRWYPLHRRLIAGFKLAHNKKKNAARLKAALDRVREKHGINCGVLRRD